MKFPNHKIIAFEGLDSSFKETNFKAFVNRLIKEANNEYDVYTESFPRYGNWSAIATEKWLNGELDRAHLIHYPEAVNSLYSIDKLSYWYESVHGQKRNIDILEDEDCCFVFDRYTLSSPIYNPIIGDCAKYYDLNFDNLIFGIPKPNIVVWMRMKNFGVLKQLIENKKEKDMNESDIEFFYKAWERSEKLIKSKRYLDKAGIELIVVECLDSNGNIKSKEQLEEEVWMLVSNKLEELNDEKH